VQVDFLNHAYPGSGIDHLVACQVAAVVDHEESGLADVGDVCVEDGMPATSVECLVDKCHCSFLKEMSGSLIRRLE